MRTVIQRVQYASVTIDGEIKSKIGNGFLLLLGIEESDTTEDVDWLVKKVAALRVFDDENGVMNRSIIDVGGEALVVSQFTLYASYKKGNRPSWFRAARHEIRCRSTRSSVANCRMRSAMRSERANSVPI